VDEESAAKDWTLFKRAIDGEDGTRNNVLVVNIGSDADNAVRLGANPGNEFNHGIRPIDVPIDGILIGEHALCESLTDDSDGLFTFAVERVEIAASDDGNAERGKESGRDGPQLPARIFLAALALMTLRRELQTGAKAACVAPGNSNAESSLVHAGQRINTAN